jgi:ribonucleoside-diphosphate reductase alpha chain
MSKRRKKRTTRQRDTAELRKAEAKVHDLTDEVERLRTEVTDAKKRRPQRNRLPDTRQSITHKFSIIGHEGYITVGLYEDGSPGEVFIRMAKMGSTVRGLVDTIAVLTSLSLQYGVPVEDLAHKFKNTRFEPSGHTKNPEIRMASSITDYIFTWLSQTFSS